MAMKINAGDDIRRGDIYLVNAFEILVREDLRGRHTAPSPEQIVSLATSMHEHGQKQPVECRRVQDNRLLLVSGFTRNAAARLIREGFTDSEGAYRQKPDFLLKCLIVDCNDQESLISNIVENTHRNQTSPIDDAFNQRRMRQDYGFEDQEIARLYRWDAAKVSRYRKLLALSPEVQLQVHRREITVTAALVVADIPEPEQAKAIEAARALNGKATAAEVKNAAREQVNEKILRDAKNGEEAQLHLQSASGTPAAPATPRPKARSVKEVRSYFETAPIEPAQKTFAAALIAYIDGTLSDEAMTAAMDAYGGAIATTAKKG